MLEVSKVLRSALIQAIRDLPPGTLPTSSSTLYSNHILPSRPSFISSTTPIDIKHSNYKNLSHFLKAAAQDGLIRNKEQKGEIVITNVFLDHPDVVAHVPFRTIAAAAQKEEAKKEKRQAESAKRKDIVVIDLWKGIGSSLLQTFFKTFGKE
jgi:translation initiation factor 2D